MMKKTPVFAFLVPALLLFSCQTTPEENSDFFYTMDPAIGEVLALFDQYWDSDEDEAAGRQFMLRFRDDPVLVLEALAVAAPFQREQMLILIGSAIANARRDDSAAYTEYNIALEFAASLDLDEDSQRMLRFIHANISHW